MDPVHTGLILRNRNFLPLLSRRGADIVARYGDARLAMTVLRVWREGSMYFNSRRIISFGELCTEREEDDVNDSVIPPMLAYSWVEACVGIVSRTAATGILKDWNTSQVWDYQKFVVTLCGLICEMTPDVPNDQLLSVLRALFSTNVVNTSESLFLARFLYMDEGRRKLLLSSDIRRSLLDCLRKRGATRIDPHLVAAGYVAIACTSPPDATPEDTRVERMCLANLEKLFISKNTTMEISANAFAQMFHSAITYTVYFSDTNYMAARFDRFTALLAEPFVQPPANPRLVSLTLMAVKLALDAGVERKSTAGVCAAVVSALQRQFAPTTTSKERTVGTLDEVVWSVGDLSKALAGLRACHPDFFNEAHSDAVIAGMLEHPCVVKREGETIPPVRQVSNMLQAVAYKQDEGRHPKSIIVLQRLLVTCAAADKCQLEQLVDALEHFDKRRALPVDERLRAVFCSRMEDTKWDPQTQFCDKVVAVANGLRVRRLPAKLLEALTNQRNVGEKNQWRNRTGAQVFEVALRGAMEPIDLVPYEAAIAATVAPIRNPLEKGGLAARLRILRDIVTVRENSRSPLAAMDEAVLRLAACPRSTRAVQEGCTLGLDVIELACRYRDASPTAVDDRWVERPKPAAGLTLADVVTGYEAFVRQHALSTKNKSVVVQQLMSVLLRLRWRDTHLWTLLGACGTKIEDFHFAACKQCSSSEWLLALVRAPSSQGSSSVCSAVVAFVNELDRLCAARVSLMPPDSIVDVLWMLAGPQGLQQEHFKLAALKHISSDRTIVPSLSSASKGRLARIVAAQRGSVGAEDEFY